MAAAGAGLPKINAEAPVLLLAVAVVDWEALAAAEAAAPNKLLLNIGGLVVAWAAGTAALDEPKPKPAVGAATAGTIVDAVAADPNTNDAVAGAAVGLAICAAPPNDSAVAPVAGVPNVDVVALAVAALTELAPNMDGAAAVDAGLAGDAVRPNEKPPLVAAIADTAGPASGFASVVVGLRPPNDGTPVDGEPKANSGFLAAVAIPVMTVAAGTAGEEVLALLPNENPAVGLMP